MNYDELHREAIELADLADAQRHEGYLENAKALFHSAFIRARRSAIVFSEQHDVEPTRSVLFRSAASLAVECGNPHEAAILITIALRGTPPPEIAEELRALLETVKAKVAQEEAL